VPADRPELIQLARSANRHARDLGVPLRALIEDGLRRVLAPRPAKAPVPFARLEEMSWQEIRDEIYGGR
jgi:hypothetical protein